MQLRLNNTIVSDRCISYFSCRPFFRTDTYNTNLVHDVESVIIQWAKLTNELLEKDSSIALSQCKYGQSLMLSNAGITSTCTWSEWTICEIFTFKCV